jgi:hypothetical protein
MSAMDSIKAKFDEYEYLLKLQTAKIEELAAENERLKTGADAHTTLRSIYTNPASSEGNRIRAAAAALPTEKPKYQVVVDLAEALKEARRRAQALGLSSIVDVTPRIEHREGEE